MYTIYLWTNLVNHKAYVGQTVNLADRKKQHLSAVRTGKSGFLHRAMRKRGVENFDLQTLAEVSTAAEADNLEAIWVALLRTNKSEFGYNCTSDGQGCVGKDHGEIALRRKLENARLRELGLYQSKHKRYDVKDEDVARLYQSGLTTRQVGERLRCGHALVRTRLAAMGIPRRPWNSYSKNEEAREKNRQGRLGKKHSLKTVEKIRTAKLGQGAGERSCRWRHDIVNEDIAKLYVSGLSTVAIGRRYDSPPATIHRRLKNLGVVIRRPGRYRKSEVACY
jgi:group I intron endonuclease